MHFNGTSWDVVYSQGIIIHAIWGSAPDDIFALGNDGGWHFDGASWTRTGQGVFEGDRIQAIWGFRSDDVWACGGSLYHYDGHNWTKLGQAPVFCLSLIGFSKNDIYMNLLAFFFPGIEIFAASMAQATAVGAALAIHGTWNKEDLPNDIIELKFYSGTGK